jgi:cellulose synthase/poly-beta-1,6-N-acetylglucosamine synthase-like glycosyltransferase
MRLVASLVWPVAIATGAFSGYLLALTVLAAFPKNPRRGIASDRVAGKFAVLIPAHNEELLIGRALASIHSADYPEDHVHAYVIADNCDDSTAEIARGLGAEVLVRTDLERRGKGHAISWALKQFDLDQYDAIVMVDADSTVGEGFFHAVNGELKRGAKVVQGYYRVTGSETSTSASLRSIGFELMHYVRPLGKRAFGGSCGLKGNGMAFDARLMAKLGWESFSVTEDAEQHVRLLDRGYSVRFAPDAIVLSEMPTTLRASRKQNLRWEAGRLATARRSIPQLLLAAVRQRSLAPLDASFELAMPPISILVLAGVGVAAAGMALGSLALAACGIASLAALALHVIGGLLLVRAPLSTWRALLVAPVYVVWKLGVYLAALFGSGSREWVRTGRPSSDA